MGEPEPMDVDAALRALNAALRLQLRGAVHYTVVAGSISGLEFMGLAERFAEYAALEIEDARRLVEKVLALGGEPATEVPAPPYRTDAHDAVQALVACEQETIAALHDVIPTTGQEPRSEALEHLVEHLIMRKQEQIDQLLRAIGETE